MMTRFRICSIVAVFIAHLLYGATSLGAQEKVGAQQILEQAVRVTGNIKDRRDKAELLYRIALAQIRAGDIAGSKKALSQTLAAKRRRPAPRRRAVHL
jgi:hypothetical protein